MGSYMHGYERLLLLITDILQWGTEDAEITVPSAEYKQLSKVLKLKPLACQTIALSASPAARYAVFIICCLRLIQLHVSKFSLNMKLMCAVLKTLSSKQYVVSFVIYTVTLGFYL